MSTQPVDTSCLRLADTLQQVITRDRLSVLPSISQLARTYHVTYGRMREAVKLLASRGIVSCRQGRKAVVIRRESDAAGGDEAADVGVARSLYHELKEKIFAGVYPANTNLPKYYRFVAERHVSTHTVCQAFSLLARDNLIRKSGRTWKVGPSPGGMGRRTGGEAKSTGAPVVLFIISRVRSTYDFIYSYPVCTFANAFHGEMDRFGFQSKLIHLSETDSEDFITYGSKSLLELVRSLGSRYAGAILYTKANEMPGLRDTAIMLGRFKKPVVFFDFTNTASHVGRSSLPLGGFFYRCFLDEPQACRKVLKRLVELGHTELGAPHFLSDRYDWIGQRIATLQHEATRFSPRPTIHTVRHREHFWGFEEVPDLQKIKETLATGPFAVQVDKARDIYRKAPFGEQLLADAESILGMCGTKQPTAIIAPNDNIAQEIFLLLYTFGIRIPRDISLISFDNVGTSRYFPISTVDFGLSTVGFKVAHLFIGDMAVPVDRHGTVHTRCTLLDRGSLAEARTTPLLLPREKNEK